MTRRIGFIGLGAMGSPMAKNLLKAGFAVTVYNRTAAKTVPLAEAGAKVAPDLKSLAAECDTIITMLTDGPAVASLVEGEEGLLALCRPGQVIIDMSTIAPQETRHFNALAAAKGIIWVDAPVSGTVKPAQDGTLVILVGGDQATFEANRDVFAAMGKASFYFGASGQGSVAKLAVNAILGVQIQVLAEAVVLGEKNGIARSQMLEMIATTAVASPIVLGKSGNFVKGEYPSAFGLALQHKDLGLAVNLGHQSGVAMPVAAAAHQTYTAAKAAGMGTEDMSAIHKQIERLAGLR
ncbi:MAG: NAD(P)-dependent oxidoreductase [Mycobacterium leprae]